MINLLDVWFDETIQGWICFDNSDVSWERHFWQLDQTLRLCKIMSFKTTFATKAPKQLIYNHTTTKAWKYE
jgi:hypothetical protein